MSQKKEDSDDVQTNPIKEKWNKLSWQWKVSLIIGGVVLIVGIINPESLEVDKVKQSSWNGSVSQVETFLKKRHLSDPSSYQSVKWGTLYKNEDGTYNVSHTFRAKNKFGGTVTETMYFTISSKGEIINYR